MPLVIHLVTNQRKDLPRGGSNSIIRTMNNRRTKNMDLENFTMDYYWLHAQDFILHPARWRAGFSSHREPRAAGPPASTLGRACLCLSAATLPLGRAGLN